MRGVHPQAVWACSMWAMTIGGMMCRSAPRQDRPAAAEARGLPVTDGRVE